jgi:hypothetical protein
MIKPKDMEILADGSRWEISCNAPRPAPATASESRQMSLVLHYTQTKRRATICELSVSLSHRQASNVVTFVHPLCLQTELWSKFASSALLIMKPGWCARFRRTKTEGQYVS